MTCMVRVSHFCGFISLSLHVAISDASNAQSCAPAKEAFTFKCNGPNVALDNIIGNSNLSSCRNDTFIIFEQTEVLF